MGNTLLTWETEIINTKPDNFLWEQDSSSILTVDAGVYQFNLTIFNVRSCYLSVVVNGESVYQADNKNINNNLVSGGSV